MDREVAARRTVPFLNCLEPEGLINAFLTSPPEGFVPVLINERDKVVPGFLAELDLFTTADKRIKNFYQKYKKFLPPFMRGFLKPSVVFVGTTVSEYALFPDGIDVEGFRKSAVSKLDDHNLRFLIVKDIPMESPLLSDRENKVSSAMISALRDSGFFILSGQALGYVPVSFHSTDEYLQRLSRSRRKDIKRKLRSFAAITVEQLRTGDGFFTDSSVELLYGLYVNVYEKSDIHFDMLTLPFFRKVFRDEDGGGIVFLYRSGGKIIGFNLCFIVRDYLMDKYVGFLYPEARELNLYFVSWLHNLDFCIRNKLKAMVAGWTDPAIKSYLGAEFTYTYHAVFVRNPLLRLILRGFKSFFESDRRAIEGLEKRPVQ